MLFRSHKGLYDTIGSVGDEEYLLPIGKAITKKRGSDVTIVAYSKAVVTALAAASILSAQDEIEVEIIDLATLKPLDTETILASVRKTGKLLVVHEAPVRAGFGAEIVRLVCDEVFDALKTAPKVLGGANLPMPYSGVLEKECIPYPETIAQAIKRIVKG